MPTRSAKADWSGTVQDGSGQIELKVGNYPYSAKTRFTDDEQVIATTNPEELIGAAQAACYNMALSARLATHGHNPDHIETECKVTLSASGLGFKISRITINVQAKVADMTESEFETHAAIAKDTCPISAALAAVPITLNASLITD